MATPFTELEAPAAAGATRTVTVTNPDKVFFPARGETKLDLARYYLAVGEGALRGVYERPTVLKRYPDGAGGEPFFQKRAPVKGRPPWIATGLGSFPSGRTARRWAVAVRCVVAEPGMVGCPKTSGARGLRVNSRIGPRWTVTEMRRAALALAGEVERRVPNEATSKWWKEERGERVFLDYN